MDNVAGERKSRPGVKRWPNNLFIRSTMPFNSGSRAEAA
jgi:hypothetical protein